ncbi:glycolipid transfer protein domain-containing protein [Parasitella parasitica]|nr:glycolipid transfer protein domain-containing protein [Parasitella parasitica]
MTYFDKLSKSYVDVDTDNGIDTMQFLEATEGVVKLFDLLGSAAFSVIQKDMNGNLTVSIKIKEHYKTNPEANATLQSLLATEALEKKKTATQGLLWLTRGLDFTAQALLKSINDPSQELKESFKSAYTVTLSPFHSWVVRPVISVAMNACPYRKDFYQKIEVVNDAGFKQMEEWVKALKNIVDIINDVFKANPNYIKGM